MMETVFKIFFSFLKIGAFSFGGGYAMIPLIEKEVVENHQWLTGKEFVDIIAITEMTPGPIAINTSTFVGYKVGKIIGAAVGTLAVILVSFILILLSVKFLIKMKDSKEVKSIFMGIRPAVIGLIISAAISVGKTSIVDIKGFLTAGLILFSILKLRLHPILCIFLAGIIGYVVY